MKVILAAAIIVVGFAVAMYALSARFAVETNRAAQSWDQANLKANDHGCPTAIFIAPNGVLEQCP